MALLFGVGYAGIIFEESLAFNKSGVGLLMAVGLWVIRSIGVRFFFASCDYWWYFFSCNLVPGSFSICLYDTRGIVYQLDLTSNLNLFGIFFYDLLSKCLFMVIYSPRNYLQCLCLGVTEVEVNRSRNVARASTTSQKTWGIQSWLWKIWIWVVVKPWRYQIYFLNPSIYSFVTNFLLEVN